MLEQGTHDCCDIWYEEQYERASLTLETNLTLPRPAVSDQRLNIKCSLWNQKMHLNIVASSTSVCVYVYQRHIEIIIKIHGRHFFVNIIVV